jgi:hypothetical protein
MRRTYVSWKLRANAAFQRSGQKTGASEYAGCLAVSCLCNSIQGA